MISFHFCIVIRKLKRWGTGRWELWTSTVCGASIRCRRRSGTEKKRFTASKRNLAPPSKIATGRTDTRRPTRSARWPKRPDWRWPKSPIGSRTDANATGLRPNSREGMMDGCCVDGGRVGSSKIMGKQKKRRKSRPKSFQFDEHFNFMGFDLLGRETTDLSLKKSCVMNFSSGSPPTSPYV